MVPQFKEDKIVFAMSFTGTLRPLLDESVVSFDINENHIVFLYLKDIKYRVAVFEYKNKTVTLKCDMDANVNRGSIKIAGLGILNSKKQQAKNHKHSSTTLHPNSQTDSHSIYEQL